MEIAGWNIYQGICSWGSWAHQSKVQNMFKQCYDKNPCSGSFLLSCAGILFRVLIFGHNQDHQDRKQDTVHVTAPVHRNLRHFSYYSAIVSVMAEYHFSLIYFEFFFLFFCSIGSILGCRAEILQLDVTDVKMNCFLTE